MGDAAAVIGFFNILLLVTVILCIITVIKFFDLLMKLVKKKIAPEKIRRAIIIMGISLVYSVLFIGFSTHFVMRWSGLPEVTIFHDRIIFEGRIYMEVTQEMRTTFPRPREHDLVLIGREEMISGATPGLWAYQVITTPTFYVRRNDFERDLVFFNDIGTWRIFELRIEEY